MFTLSNEASIATVANAQCRTTTFVSFRLLTLRFYFKFVNWFSAVDPRSSVVDYKGPGIFFRDNWKYLISIESNNWNLVSNEMRGSYSSVVDYKPPRNRTVIVSFMFYNFKSESQRRMSLCRQFVSIALLVCQFILTMYNFWIFKYVF